MMFDLAVLRGPSDAANLLEAGGPQMQISLVDDNGRVLFTVTDRLGRPGTFYDDSNQPYFYLGDQGEAWADLKTNRTYRLQLHVDPAQGVDQQIVLQPRLQGGGIR
jgi:hypothetical protein